MLAIADELTEDGMVLRYRTDETDDGLHGEEGTFTICSFWLVSALCEIGEVDRARELCERLLSYASALGLYAEEIDPRSGRHLGNFPQAFTHLALINAVMHVIHADEALEGAQPLSFGRGLARAPPGRRSPRPATRTREHMSDIPAGWQPDPRGRHEYRYWDGSQWTDHVSDKGEVSSDPVADASRAQRFARRPPRRRSSRRGDGRAGPSRRPARAEPARSPSPSPATEPEPAAVTEPGPVAAGPEPAAARGKLRPSRRNDRAVRPHHRRQGGRAGRAALQGRRPGDDPQRHRSRLRPLLHGRGQRRADRRGLLAATLVAVVLSYFSFVLFLVGFVIWAGAAVFALKDLRGGPQSVTTVSLKPNVVGLLLIVAGALLIISLFLPYYHLKFSVNVPGFSGSESGNGSGWEAFGIIDVVLLLVGLASIAAGAASLGLGPVTAAEMPRQLPMIVAVGGAIAVVLLLFRMFLDPVDTGLAGGLAGARPTSTSAARSASGSGCGRRCSSRSPTSASFAHWRTSTVRRSEAATGT